MASNSAIDEVVANTTDLALTQVEPTSAPGTVLAVLAYLAPDGIPKALLLEGASALTARQRHLFEDPLRLTEALGVLARHSLVQISVDAVHIHRRVQERVRDRQGEPNRRDAATITGQMVLAAFPRRPDDQRGWFLTKQLVSHALAVADHLEELDCDPHLTARLLIQVARYLAGSGGWKDARSTLERAVGIVNERGDPHSATYGTALAQLGVVAVNLGEFDEARVKLERALEIHRKARNDDQAADDMTGLGRVMLKLGRPADARGLLHQALEIHQRVYGPQELEVPEDLVVLADVAVNEGRYGEAVDLMERAASVLEERYGPEDQDAATIRFYLRVLDARVKDEQIDFEHTQAFLGQLEKVYGTTHFEVATARQFLARILVESGDLEGARANLEQALAIHRETYGDRHYEVATDLLQLASLHFRTGAPEEAERALEEVAAILRMVGPEDLEAFLRQCELDRSLQDMGMIEETRDSLHRTTTVFRRDLGDDHPSVAAALVGLAQANRRGSQFGYARSGLREALWILEQFYGPTHRLVARVLDRLAEVAEDQRQYQNALELREHALRLDSEALSDHPQIAEDKLGLIKALVGLDRRQDARQALTEALAVYTNVFGVDHPVVARIRVIVAETLAKLDDHAQAVAELRVAVSSFEVTPGMERERAQALVQLAGLHRLTNDPVSARAALESAIPAEGDPEGDFPGLGSATLTLAYVLQELGNLEAASTNLTVALDLLRERLASDSDASKGMAEPPAGVEPLTLEGVAEGRARQGDRLLQRGRIDEAYSSYQAGLELAQETETTVEDDLSMLFRLCYVAARRGQIENARNLLVKCASLARAAGNPAVGWTLRIQQYEPLIELAGPSDAVEQLLRELVDRAGDERSTMTPFRATLGAAPPDGWRGKEEINLQAPDGQANVIASHESIDPDINSHQYAELQASLLRSEFPGYREHSSGPKAVFGGRAGYERSFEWTPPDGVPVRQIQHYHAADGEGYTATATTTSRHFPAVESVLRDVLESLDITTPASTGKPGAGA